MMLPASLKPPSDYRIWIDGSYKDGYIGYGVIILPGYREIFGGQEGSNSAEAEHLAAEKALATLPKDALCVIYCDFLPLIQKLSLSSPHITAQYMNDQDPRHQRAHTLANQGRRAASGETEPKNRRQWR